MHLLLECSPDTARSFWPQNVSTSRVEDRSAAAAARRAWLAGVAPGRAVLVTDLLGLGAEDARQARTEGFSALAQLNEDGVGRYDADLTFNGDGFLPDREVPAGTGLLIEGPRHHVIDERVAGRRPSRPWHGERIRSILVTFGGADPGRLTECWMEDTGVGSGDVEWTLVIGPAFDRHRRDELLRRTRGNVRVLEPQDDLGGVIVAHDLLITMGGRTSYEGMCLGRPVAAVQWGGMARFVRAMAASGLVFDLGPARGATARLRDALADAEVWRALAWRGWQTIDGRGAERVLERIVRAVYPGVPGL